MNYLWGNNLIIREWLNGGLVPLNLSLVFVICLFLWDSYAVLHKKMGLRWVDAPGVHTACALAWVFSADALRALSVWVAFRVDTILALPLDINATSLLIIASTIGVTVASVIGVAATLRCIFLFTPKGWGHWYWIGTVLVDATWLAWTHFPMTLFR